MLIGIKRKPKDGEAPAADAAPVVEGKADELVVTERAAKQIAQQVEAEGYEGGALRIAVQGGGCSGLSYVFSVVSGTEEGDIIAAAFGAQVCMDKRSFRALQGSVLDFETSLARRGFKLKNPQATSTCSCGESFSM